MTSYIVIRGIVIDLMEWLSELFIRRLKHGWLWTQAILRPLDKLFRVLLFVLAIFSLFMLYGWHQDSYVGKKISTFLHMHVVSFEDTNTITCPYRSFNQ